MCALRRVVLLVALVSLSSACGSQSTRLERGAAGNGGTAGSGGETSGGGSGGCADLVAAGGIVHVEQSDRVVESSPHLAAASDDGSRLTAAFVSSVPGSVTRIAYATFSPWQTWPHASLGPTEATLGTYGAFDMSPTAGNRLGFLVQQSRDVATGLGTVFFAPVVDPDSSVIGPGVDISGSAQPMFAAPGPPGYHLVADSDHKRLTGHVVTHGGTGISVSDVLLSCGPSIWSADAVPYSGGWLAAVPAPKDAPTVGCWSATTYETRLDILRVGVHGSASYVTSIDHGSAPIAMAPHAGGAYVVWKAVLTFDLSELRFARVDADSGAVIGPYAISTPRDNPVEGFDVAALGSQLVVAWGSSPSSDVRQLVFSVFDEWGRLALQRRFDLDFSGPPAIAASPTGNSLVAAWLEATPGGGSTVSLGRFDCSDEP